MKIPANVVAKPEAARVASILESLDDSEPGAEVFEAFEKLDELPADVVRAVLVSVTGPAPDPEQLDAATRRAHGFPELPLVFRCTSAVKPLALEELNRVEQDQLRAAGTCWDGLDLPPSARLLQNGGEPSFAGNLELKRFAFEDGTPALDVVLHGDGSGALFDAGTSRLVGAVAYGIVELKDKAARAGLQHMLASQPDPAALARVEAERARAEVAAKAAAEARAAAEAKAAAETRAAAEAEARSQAKAKADAKAKAEADAAAFAAAHTSLFPPEEPTTQKRSKVVASTAPATRTAPAKKTGSARVAAGPAPARKLVAEAAGGKTAPLKKAIAEKTAAEATSSRVPADAAPKEAAARKAAASRKVAAPKKSTAKKVAAPQKSTAKKATAAKEATAAKKSR